MTQPLGRRALIAKAAALAASQATRAAPLAVVSLLAGCGSGDDAQTPAPPPSPSAPPPPSAAPLEIAFAASATSVAGTSLQITATGLKVAEAFTVIYSFPVGDDQTVTPIRTAEKTLVLHTPILIDTSTGQTTPGVVRIKVTQGSLTSNVLQLQVTDMPTVASMGLQTGDIASAVLGYQVMTLGQAANRLDAIAAFGAAGTDTTTARANLRAMMREAQAIRRNVDALQKGTKTSIILGTAADGTTQTRFDTYSLELMDRVLALHLAAVGYFPAPVPLATGASAFEGSAGLSMARAAAWLSHPLAIGQSLSALINLLDKALSKEVGAVTGIATNAGTALINASKGEDDLIAAVSAVAGIVALTATLASLPALATGAAIAGLALGAYSLAKDIQTLNTENSTQDWLKVGGDLLGLVPVVRGGKALLQTLGAVAGASGLLYLLGPDKTVAPFSAASLASANAIPRQQFGILYGNISGQPAGGLQGIGVRGPGGNLITSVPSDRNGDYRMLLPVGSLGIGPFLLSGIDLESGLDSSQWVNLDLSGLKSDAQIRSPIIVYQAPGTTPPSPTPTGSDYVTLDFVSGTFRNNSSYRQVVAGYTFEVLGQAQDHYTLVNGGLECGFSNTTGWLVEILAFPKAFGSVKITLLSFELAIYGEDPNFVKQVLPIPGLDVSLTINSNTFTTIEIPGATPVDGLRSVNISASAVSGNAHPRLKWVIRNVRLQVSSTPGTEPG